MLAYLFWHWARAGIARSVYEDLQRRFHAALRDAPPSGFIASHTAGIQGAAWAAAGGDAYEDWYLVRDWASLGLLNDAAVQPPLRRAHDSAAEAAIGGTAGLYRLRLGGHPERAAVACWFAKPERMSYPALDAALGELVSTSGGALWYRQLVLGPAPEFCLLTAMAVRLPAPFEGQAIRRRLVWP